MVVGSLEEPTQHLVGHWSDRIGLLASPEDPSLIKKIERTAATIRSKRDRSLSRDIGRTPSYIDINVSTKKGPSFTPAPTELMRVKRINTLPGITPLDYRLKFPLPLVD